MSDKAHESGKQAANVPEDDGGARLRELLQQLPKEMRQRLLAEGIELKKLETEMTDAQKEVLWESFRKNILITEIAEPDRAAYVTELTMNADSYQKMTEMEKRAFWEVQEYRHHIATASEWDKEKIRREMVKAKNEYAMLSESEREEYWEDNEALDKFIGQAVPIAKEHIQKLNTPYASNPSSDSVALTTDERREYITKALSPLLDQHGEDLMQFSAEFLQMLFDAFLAKVEPLKSYAKIDKQLRILLGDAYLSPLPVTIRGMLKARGIDKDATKMSFAEFVEALCLPEKESWFETVMPTLDMLFEQRYGWPEGTVRTKPITELCLALEHAIEHDDPQKPSIWDMTGS